MFHVEHRMRPFLKIAGAAPPILVEPAQRLRAQIIDPEVHRLIEETEPPPPVLGLRVFHVEQEFVGYWQR